MRQKIRSDAGTILLPYWLRWSLYIVTTLLILTGIIWLFSYYFLGKGEYGGSNQLEILMMKLHGFCIIPALFLYGSLLRSHIIKAWKEKTNRSTGLIILFILMLLALTGYFLYYYGNESLRPAISILHWGVGILLTIALPIHIIIGRKKRNQKNKSRKKVKKSL